MGREDSELNAQLEHKNAELEQKVQERLAELRKSEEQVQHLQKMDAVGRLAGGIAHDFNNLLAAIMLYSELLADNADRPEVVRSNLKEIKDVTSRGAALTKQLLLQTIGLNPLIRQMEKMLATLIGESIKIQTKLAADLKLVNIDPTQWSR